MFGDLFRLTPNTIHPISRLSNKLYRQLAAGNYPLGLANPISEATTTTWKYAEELLMQFPERHIPICRAGII